jgi:LacI family transcriptional regulator
MSRPSPFPIHIALAFPTAQAHLQILTQGITAYANTQGRWILTTGGEAGALSIEQLKGWRGHGVIAALIRPSEARTARRLMRTGTPVVTIAGALRSPGVPRVTVANPAIGRMAADHLLKCGFRRFAFYGLHRVAYSQDRHAGFVEQLQQAGLACADAHFAPGVYGLRRPWVDDVMALRKWLTGLTPPLGIFAVNDFRARLVIDACRLSSLQLPTQVGIVGADNDQTICEFSEPGLSSIDCDWYRVGFEAARTLHQLLEGATPVPDLRIAPRQVISRGSTAVTVTEDPRLLKAVAYIRDHLEEVFGVEKLLEISDVSRRKLEQIFRAELHMSPYRYLCLKRVEHARTLLQCDPPVKLKQIGRLCGFRDSRRLRLVFMRLEAQTPAQYRRNLRRKPPGAPR